jgi:hypothetical protein
MNLIYTVAFDLPGWRTGRTMAKLLSSSLLRGFWSGQLMVFRNFAHPLFPVERKNLEEVFIQTPDFGKGSEAGSNCLKAALEARFEVLKWIPEPEQYEWICYLDADCLALRNLDHLFVGDADLLVQPERGRSLRDDAVFNGYLESGKEPAPTGNEPVTLPPPNAWLGRDGINAGTFAVRGSKYAEVMAEWSRIYKSEPARHTDFRDQTAFNKLLLETGLRVKPFERGEIMFPFHLDKGFLDYKEAALLHFVGGRPKDKVDLAFALHMMRTYGEEGGLFLDLLES